MTLGILTKVGMLLCNVVSIAYHEYARPINTCKAYKYVEASVLYGIFNSVFSYQVRGMRVV